jgi:hypothetical protein
VADHEVSFEPVALPEWRGDRGALGQEVAAWVGSPPMRALAEASGWSWPTADEPVALVDELVERSVDWDYRGGKERNFISASSAEVDGRVLDDDLVVSAADALGLVHAGAVPDGITHVAVLSGLFRACVNRVRFVVDRGLVGRAPLAVLSAHRPLGGDEPTLAEEAGYGHLDDEAAVSTAATIDLLGLAEPSGVEWVGGDQHGAADRAAGSVHRWARVGAPPVAVFVAPSSVPDDRRANTEDQLRFWAARDELSPADHVLVVTTQIYVPFQHLDAVRVLGLEVGCRVSTVGVDATSAAIPLRAFGPRDWLQELRSALRAAQRLLAVVDVPG